MSGPVVSARPRRLAGSNVVVGSAGVAVLAALFALGLSWAKWFPYADKIEGLRLSHTWSGGAIFTNSGTPGSAPTLAGAWDFTTAYFESIWKALVVALLLAASIDSMVPKSWLVRVMNRRTPLLQSITAGAIALPSLMCTCCTAPVAVGLRRRGAATASTLAYWTGNPVLNPAVLAFLFLVAPWQFGVVRIVIGAALVFGATALVASLLADRRSEEALLHAVGSLPPTEPQRLRALPAAFIRSLGRLALVLVPEYFVVVLVIGWLSGWMSSFQSLSEHIGILAVIVVAVIGTLLVIPTAGEIPVVLALAAAGVGAGPIGALLITLPALSVPSMVMVGRALTWRVTAAMAGAVVVCGVLGGGLLWALS